MNFTVNYDFNRNSRIAGKYITGEDKKSLSELAKEMATACCDEDISAIASHIVNARRRNEKADKHDALINIAEREVLALNPNEGFKLWGLAWAMQRDRECFPYLDRDTKKHYYSTPTYKAPIGAVTYALNKLLNAGAIRIVYVGRTKLYVRN